MGAALGGGSKKREGIVAINITPMVDIMLVLLIIMMVSATYIVSQSLKVELPKSSTSDESTSSVAAVTIQKDGKFFFNQQPVTEDQLLQKLREKKSENADMNLVITADTDAHHGSVVHVIDIAKQEGILKFAINVERN